MAGRFISSITKKDSPEDAQKKAKEEAEKKAKKEREEADKKAKKDAEDAQKKAANPAGESKISLKNMIGSVTGKSTEKIAVSPTTPKPPASIADAALKATPAGMFRLHLPDDQSALFKFGGTTTLHEVWSAAQKRYPSNLVDINMWEFRTMQDMPLSSKAWDVSLESLGSPSELRLVPKKPVPVLPRGASGSFTPATAPTPAPTSPTPALVGTSTLGRIGVAPAVASALRGSGAPSSGRNSFVLPATASTAVPPNSLRIYVPGDQNNMVVRIEAGQTLEHAYHKVAQKYPGLGLEDITKFEFRTIDMRVHIPMTTLMDKTPVNELSIVQKQLKIVLPAGIAATFDFHDGSNLAEIVDEFKKKYFQYAMGKFELVAADTDTTLRNYGLPLKFVHSREFLYRAVSASDEPEEFTLGPELDPKGVKPPPQTTTQRVWWLLAQLLISMNKGVFLTPVLYVPAAAWKSKPAIPAFRSTSGILSLTPAQIVTKLQALDYTISQLAKLQSIYIGEIDQLMAAFDSFLATGDVVHAHLARELPFMKARVQSQRGATARKESDPGAQAAMSSKTYDPTFVDIIYQQQLKKFFETCDFLSKYTAWFQEGGNSIGLELTAKLAQYIQETFLVFIMHDLRTYLHKYFRQGCEEL